MGNQWYNLNKWVRVIVTNNDIALISRYRQSKKVPKSTLQLDDQHALDIMVKKGIFGRYKQGEETYYLFNK
tara:strand:- start:2280 stop:2492 length:213 start_codon:yes stop_codon:yes gene_type:complete